MTLTSIVAVADNGIIGNNNDLVWHLPKDLKHFKKLTKGHHIIMGRKTWESIGSKPLPNRTHIVISRNTNYVAKGALVVSSVEDAIKAVENDDQPFIVGGAQIYKVAMPFIKRLEITHVHHKFKGDTHFPEWKKNDWILEVEELNKKDEKHAYDYTFTRYSRK